MQAQNLRQAQTACRKAKAAVQCGAAALDAQHAMAGEIVRSAYQQQTNLMPLALMGERQHDRRTWRPGCNGRPRCSTPQQAQLDGLLALIQAQLEAAKERLAAPEGPRSPRIGGRPPRI